MKEEIIESLKLLAMSMVFGLIACFANTQSVIVILLAGMYSTMYAVRAAALNDFIESIFTSEKFFSNTVSVVNLILEFVIMVLTIVSIAGLFWGVIEPNFINIIISIWYIVLTIFTIILILREKGVFDTEDTEEETTELEEE
jgi:hypothetical protein